MKANAVGNRHKISASHPSQVQENKRRVESSISGRR